MSDKVKASRRAFDREFKLQVVKEYHESGKNIAKTARKFEIDRKLDGKENDEINIEGIPDYEMPQADEIDGAADVEFHLESEDDSEDNADEEAEYEADETVGVQ